MIDLITGLPGNCKTLYVIAWIKKWAEKDNRPVFYHGIKLTDEGRQKLVGWSELADPLKWYEVPTGAIVLIDEAQGIFRNRSINAQTPKHVSELETHRHLGIDLVFITQHPMLIDPAIRRLAGRHRHMVRIWGTEASTVHEWSAVRDNCDKPAARKDSEKSKWLFDKSIYPLYKSAEMHTVKRSIPKRLIFLALVPVAILAAVFAVRSLLLKEPAKPVSGQTSALSNQGVANGQGVQHAVFDPVRDAKAYVWSNTARVTGLQLTAPKYDELTKPSRVPVPAACIRSAKACECYSQQATPLAVTLDQCMQIVKHGYFEDFDRDGRPHQPSAQPVQTTALVSDLEPERVIVLDKQGFGVNGQRPE